MTELTIKPMEPRAGEWRRLSVFDDDAEVGVAVLDKQKWLTIIADTLDAEATLVHAVCGIVVPFGVGRVRIKVTDEDERQRLMTAYQAVAAKDHVYLEVTTILGDEPERWISLADAAKALISAAKTAVLRAGRVSDYEFYTRLSICAKCKVMTPSEAGHPAWCGTPGKKSCRTCGCYLPVKARDAAQMCKQNKWPTGEGFDEPTDEPIEDDIAPAQHSPDNQG